MGVAEEGTGSKANACRMTRCLPNPRGDGGRPEAGKDVPDLTAASRRVQTRDPLILALDLCMPYSCKYVVAESAEGQDFPA
jgi:hypothetical protein